MALTIRDVRSIIEPLGWEIEKDPQFTCRRWIATAPDGTKTPIRYIPTTDKMIAEIKKAGIDKFVKAHAAEDGGGRPVLTKAKGPKPVKGIKKAVLPQQPAALKVRRLASVVSKFETSAAEAPLESLDYTVKVPKQHKGYYCPNFVKNVSTRLSIGRNIFLAGPGGCGKTEFVYALADLYGTKVVRVNFNTGTTEQHLIGRMIAKAGATEFIYGLVPLAMKNGWWIVFDEIDYAMPEHLSVLQPVLEGNPLMVTQNVGEEIVPHENFRMFATANTKGRGDESQGYVGTNFLNMAFLDRWSIFEMEYSKEEPSIAAAVLQQDDTLVLKLVQYFELLRKAAYGGELNNAIFSTRRMIQVCEALAAGESLKEALTYELWSRYDKHEVDVMKECAADVFDREHYLTGKWVVGMEHFVAPSNATP